MAIRIIQWDDGSSDTITVTYTGSVGSSPITVRSDPNLSPNARTKILGFKDSNGVELKRVTVIQAPYTGAYSGAYGNDYSYLKA